MPVSGFQRTSLSGAWVRTAAAGQALAEPVGWCVCVAKGGTTPLCAASCFQVGYWLLSGDREEACSPAVKPGLWCTPELVGLAGSWATGPPAHQWAPLLAGHTCQPALVDKPSQVQPARTPFISMGGLVVTAGC